jgi:RHS repeat-associated protein
MPAPILTLQSGDPDGSERPILTLDRSRLTTGLWTSTMPDGFANSVQVYASGVTPGILQPGESVRVPVYYAGLQQPWPGNNQIEFEIRIRDANDPTPIDWDGFIATGRPEWIAADAWSAIMNSFVGQVGPTWGDYIRMLSDNATYLSRLGVTEKDVNNLYGFEFQQANGISAISTLASATDAKMTTPGLPLAFGRSFGNTITERYSYGPLGRGWSAPGIVHAVESANGIVTIYESADAIRRFTPDSRTPGTYFSGTGDSSKLRKLAGGIFELTAPRGIVTRFRAADGLMDYIQDSNGNRITSGYASGRLATLTHSSGAALTFAYNAAGLLQSVTDSAGRVTTYGYDPSNTLLQTVTSPQGTTTYTYANAGPGSPLQYALTSITEPGGRTQTFAYNAVGRLLSSNLNNNVGHVDFSYDTAGGVTATDLAGVQQKLFFDEHGFLLRQEDGTGNYLLIMTDDAGRPIKVTDAAGRTQTYAWCDCGQLASATDELGHTVNFTLGGPFNHPTQFIDAKGNSTSYTYDARGNLLSTQYADGSIERIAYDALGNPTTLTNRRGQPIQYAYNAAGQVTRETFPDGTHNDYTYDTRCRLTTAVDAQGTTTFTYDTADRLTRVDYPTGRWLAYDYDAGGRRTKLTDHTGFVVKYGYDPAGRLVSLKDGADTLIDTYAYDAAGRLAREDKGNGTYTVYTYDAAGRVLHLVNYAPGGAVNSRFDYTYDATGRRVGMATLDGTWAYTYDLTGQLTHAIFSSANPAVILNQDEAYAYDAAGNRIQTVINGITINYTTNVLNQYTTIGNSTYRYDNDGNLIEETSAQGATHYNNDIRNRLIGVSGPQGAWKYEYNVLGNRTAVVKNGVRTEYLGDPTGMGNIIAVYNSTGARIRTYTYGHGLVSAYGVEGSRYYDYDALGSTAGVSDAAGDYVNHYTYDPFGNALISNEIFANPFGYVGAAGVIADGNGLLYMRSRFYDVSVGRFIAQDPIRLEGNYNLYRYSNNNPVTYIDPQGMLYVGNPFSEFPPEVQQLLYTEAYFEIQEDKCYIIKTTKVLLIVTQFAYSVLSELSVPVTIYNLLTANLTDKTFTVLINETTEYIQKNCDPPPPPPPPGPGPGGTGGGNGGSGAVGSVDPNEKFGAAGYGAAAFVRGVATIPYRINFENLGPGSVPTPSQPATAPAQRVEVTDQLTPNLDWSTVQFTEFGYGDAVVTIPGAGSTFSTQPT